MIRHFPILNFTLSIVSATLLAIIMFIFLSEYRKTRARFSLGLSLFAGVFLVKELLNVVLVIDRADRVPFIGPQIQTLVLLAQVAALGTLLYLVSR